MFKQALLACLVAASIPTPATCDVTDDAVVLNYSNEASDIGWRVWLAGQDAGLFYDDMDSDTREVVTAFSSGGNLTPTAKVTIRRVSKAEHERAKERLNVIVEEYRVSNGEIEITEVATQLS